jgi:hypothetical protein
MAINLSPLRRLASSRLATLNTQYLGLYPANPRVREISPISATRPSQMDGPDLLATSCLASSCLATLNTKSSALPLTSFRVRSDLMPEIYPSLQRVLFLFLFRSDGPHAVRNFGWDPTISDASPPSLHILLTWKNFDSALIPPEPTLFLFVHRCTF